MDRGAWWATGHGVTESNYHFHFPIIKEIHGYYVCMLSHSVMSDSATTRTVAHQAPLSMGFCRKNTGVGCHFPLQRIFLTQESKLTSLALAGGFFTIESPGKHVAIIDTMKYKEV